jgi:DNA-directed RNA polymerase subunit E'/Rpb7
MQNPWDQFVEQHPIGSTVEGEVKNTTEFGLFVGLPGDIDGMVHLTDIDWTRDGEEAMQDFRKGQLVKVKVLDVDIEKERISLGIKQLEADPFESGMATLKKGDVVTGTISSILETGIEITLVDGVPAFIRKSELSRDRSSSGRIVSPSAKRSMPRSPRSTEPRARSGCRSRRARSTRKNARWPSLARRIRAPALAIFSARRSTARAGRTPIGRATPKRRAERPRYGSGSLAGSGEGAVDP